jgi:hypothetical protein
VKPADYRQTRNGVGMMAADPAIIPTPFLLAEPTFAGCRCGHSTLRGVGQWLIGLGLVHPCDGDDDGVTALIVVGVSRHVVDGDEGVPL